MVMFAAASAFLFQARRWWCQCLTPIGEEAGSGVEAREGGPEGWELSWHLP